MNPSRPDDIALENLAAAREVEGSAGDGMKEFLLLVQRLLFAGDTDS